MALRVESGKVMARTPTIADISTRDEPSRIVRIGFEHGAEEMDGVIQILRIAPLARPAYRQQLCFGNHLVRMLGQIFEKAKRNRRESNPVAAFPNSLQGKIQDDTGPQEDPVSGRLHRKSRADSP